MPPGWEVPGSPGENRTTPAYGSQDPVIEFYSTQNGSGGNVTWDITLPVDHNATANQSDLYEAIEFGMVVTAPSAWMDQCFLQLQLYPDSTWSSPRSDNGNWIGAVIGWQIQATTGLENPCFYSPLYANGVKGPDYLNLTQGDRINVTMTGWPGDPTGELVTIKDLTHTANESYATAYNSTGGYPLDPAYSANDVQDALQWGTGGDFPVFFGIVSARGGNPTIPSNNTYDGCSPGPPPSTAQNPSVPCPSYDPGSWINDTLHPFEINEPTFFNATNRSGPPAQVSFSQAYGGYYNVSGSPGAACAGRVGSSYCSYPWFSYSCAVGAFEFGATDFPGVSTDFGKYNQYAQTTQKNAVGILYYPAMSYSVPTCAGPSYTLNLGPETANGTVTFLNQNYTSETAVSGLAPGEYQLEGRYLAGGGFASWSTSGGVVASYPDGSWTTVTVTGDGSIYAVNGNGQGVEVTFDDSPSGEIAFNREYPLIIPAEETAADGAVGGIDTGIYALLAYPPQGFEFGGWTSSGPGLVIAAPSLPFTSMVLTGSQLSASITATYLKSAAGDRLLIGAFDPANSTFGGGMVSLGGFLTTDSKAASGLIPVGTYSLSAIPFAGYKFYGWYYSPSSIMLNFTVTTNVTLENGTLNPATPAGEVVAIFIPDPVEVTFSAAVGAGGAVIEGFGFVESGGMLHLTPGANYTVCAAPAVGWGFVSWGPPASKSVWNHASGSWREILTVNGTATVEITYGPALPETLSFHIDPVGAGEISFNGDNTYTDGDINSSVGGGGTYVDGAVASTGFEFSKWSSFGDVTIGEASSANSTVTVSGSGDLNVTFVPLTFPITLLTNSPEVASLEIDDSLATVGSTVLLAPGAHTIIVDAPTGTTFDSWSSTSALAVETPDSDSTTMTVSGPGALTALISPFAIGIPTVSPGTVDVGISVNVVAPPPTGGTYAGFTTVWNGLPPGCLISPGVDGFTCSPSAPGEYDLSVTFTDQWGAPATSPAAFLFVNPDPSISSLTLSASSVDVGVSTNLSAVVSGGTAPFTWTYTGLPVGCFPATQGTLECSPSAIGAFNVTVTVTDAFGKTADGVVHLIVNALPSIQVSASSASFVLGSHVTIDTVVSGGTSPISLTYSGLPTGCPTTTAASFSCTPTQSGTYHVTVTATDAFGKSASQIVTLVVNKPSSSIFGLLSVEVGIGLLLLVVIALVVLVALRRRPKKPTIVATRAASPPAAAPTPPTGTRPAPKSTLPEWSEEEPPVKEWQEGQ